ncbi:1-aminocyclopropane-1-carboxylate synthase-like protein 1 [Colletotrichum tofieldiae]|nr:1-aminocyclopropane-1-carboxylate synthase-like protein 1 [Colletotrichum tofieldiae]
MSPLPPSKRGWDAVRPDLMIDLSRRLAADEYHPIKNPKGIVDLGSAINGLMQEDLGPWVRRRLKGLPTAEHLQYNDTQGSSKLLQSVASFMNWYFRCRKPLGQDNILIANGVTTLLNSLAFNIADEGSAILMPTPSYGMFSHDVVTRNSLHLVPVPCDDIVEERFRCRQGSDGESSRWQSELVRRLEKALGENQSIGRRTAAVLLANPENPLGRCYDREVLLEVSRFCEKNRLHLVVDEIYAATAFSKHHSMLGLDLGSNAENVHVLWGMSKVRFCATNTALLSSLDGNLPPGLWMRWSPARVPGHLQRETPCRNEDSEVCFFTKCTLLPQGNDFNGSVPSMFGWVSAWSAAVASLILDDRHFLQNAYFPTLQKRLDTRRGQVMAQLTQLDVPFVAPEAGFFVFVDLSRWLDQAPIHARRGSTELELLSQLMANRVFLEPGQAFFSARPGWFRLNFGNDEKTVDLGLRKLTAFLKLVTLRESIDDAEDEVFEKLGQASPHPGETTRFRRWRRQLCFGSGDDA